MKSRKCLQCGFVGASDSENCKGCGAPLLQSSTSFHQPNQVQGSNYGQQPQEGVKKGWAIFALVLGIVSFFTLGLLGVGAVTGIIVAIVAMGKIKRNPWEYGGRGMAIAGLVLSITSFVSVVPVGIIAAIAIPNLLAARRAANEGSAIHSLRKISAAEAEYYGHLQKYATIDELAAHDLIDPMLASGTKNGYRFSLELTSNYPDPDGFEVIGVPVTYQSSGRRSFYTDESAVIRASDNQGGPSSKLDPPLVSDYSDHYVPNPRGAPADYRRETDY